MHMIIAYTKQNECPIHSGQQPPGQTHKRPIVFRQTFFPSLLFLPPHRSSRGESRNASLPAEHNVEGLVYATKTAFIQTATLGAVLDSLVRRRLRSMARRPAHIIASNYLQLFYSFQPTKLLLAA